MSVRIFHCADCGHRMRFRGAECGKCHMKKFVYQRLGFYVAIAVALLLAAGMMLWR